MIDTTPGNNQIDFWIAIPTLTNTILGRINSHMEIPFRENSVVIGNGTKLFTLADIVKFGMNQNYTIPLMIEYNKDACLESSGNGLNAKRVCTTFGVAASDLNSNVRIWTRPLDGQKFVILGR